MLPGELSRARAAGTCDFSRVAALTPLGRAIRILARTRNLKKLEIKQMEGRRGIMVS